MYCKTKIVSQQRVCTTLPISSHLPRVAPNRPCSSPSSIYCVIYCTLGLSRSSDSDTDTKSVSFAIFCIVFPVQGVVAVDDLHYSEYVLLLLTGKRPVRSLKNLLQCEIYNYGLMRKYLQKLVKAFGIIKASFHDMKL